MLAKPNDYWYTIMIDCFLNAILTKNILLTNSISFKAF